MNSLYWHDYETFGIDPRYDRPAQFAGVRTDEALNIIGEPLMLYCQLAQDSLPSPQACLVTHITPQYANQHGVPEAEFIRQVHQVLAQPGTCGVGYNSLRFDDEFTRYSLYRHFYDPYAREWQNGNSRWDIIDMVRLTRALRPEGMHWPDEDGLPSFRLEALTQANGIGHENAHDALGDVYATIALAKCIKTAQPKLYDYVYQHRQKKRIAPLLNWRQRQPVLHISRMYSRAYCGTALVVPLAPDPNNPNGIIVYDLRYSPDSWLDQPADVIQQWLFSPASSRPEGIKRPALKVVHINKCPIIVPESTLDAAAEKRLDIDRRQHQHHLDNFSRCTDLVEKLQTVFTHHQQSLSVDPDAALYHGDFFSQYDKQQFATIHSTPVAALAQLDIAFEDPRLNDLLFRYRARNWPDSLTESEKIDWQQYCHQRLTRSPAPIMTIARFNEAITQCQQNANASEQALLSELMQYGEQIIQQ